MRLLSERKAARRWSLGGTPERVARAHLCRFRKDSILSLDRASASHRDFHCGQFNWLYVTQKRCTRNTIIITGIQYGTTRQTTRTKETKRKRRLNRSEKT
jgi:hypothetical protein